jgi:hypothetical protein
MAPNIWQWETAVKRSERVAAEDLHLKGNPTERKKNQPRRTSGQVGGKRKRKRQTRIVNNQGKYDYSQTFEKLRGNRRQV